MQNSLFDNLKAEDSQGFAETKSVEVRQVNPFPVAEVREFDTQKRNDFQSKFSAKEIRNIENKFLDPKLRVSRENHPAFALTEEERMIYVKYLEAVGRESSAKSFREYVKPIETEKKITKK